MTKRHLRSEATSCHGPFKVRGKKLRNTYEDTTYVAYTMHFKDEYKNDVGMSWCVV